MTMTAAMTVQASINCAPPTQKRRVRKAPHLLLPLLVCDIVDGPSGLYAKFKNSRISEREFAELLNDPNVDRLFLGS